MSLPGPTSDGPVEPEAPQSLTSTVLRGAGLSASGYAVAQLLTFGVYVVLARLLEPRDFGDFAAATVLVGFTLLITDSGMGSAIIQRRDRIEEAASTAVVATVIGGIAFSLVMLAAAPLIGAFFDSSEVTAIAAAMSGVILLRSIVGVPDGLLIRRFSFVRRLVVEPVQVIVFGVAAVWAAAGGLGAWALVIGQYASFTTEAVLIWVLVRWRPKLRLASFAMWKELVSYGRHIIAATTVLRVGEQSDTVIVGRLLGAAPLGQFRYAFRIASTPFAMLLAGASYVLFPAFARIAHDRHRLEAAFERSLHWMCVLAFPAGLILLPLGEPLTVVLLGDVWRSAGYAAMAMCAYTAGGAITSVVSEALKARGRPEPLTRMHIVTTLVTAASMLALVPLGLSAVAAGFSLGALGGAAYSVRVMHRVMGTDVAAMIRQIWPPAVAGVIMAGAVFAAEWLLIDAESHGTALGVGLLAVEGLIGAATYFSALAVVAPDSARELVTGLRAAIARGIRVSRHTPEGTTGGAGMSTPVFSVVIPAYNAPRTIESCVRSVLAQTWPDFELIVVDDGSTDDTADRVAALASDDARIHLIRQENRGTAGARNTGIAHARGRYVSFLDNDDLWMPNYLEEMHRALEADPSAGMAYTDGWNLGDSNRKIRRLTSLEHYPPVSPTASDEEFLVSLIDINFITSSTTVRRQVLEEVGGFDPTIRGSDDWDLWLRIVTRGYRAVRAAGMLHIQRDRPGSQSRDELMMLRGMRRVLIRALDEYDLPPRARTTGQRRLQNVDRRIGWLAGESVPLRIYYGSRRRVGNVVRWALDWRQWRSAPPEDVTAAFPDLTRV